MSLAGTFQPSERLPVPAAGREDRIWTVNPDLGYSRSERLAGSGPYQSSIPATIADYSPTLNAELVADIEDAARALAGFDRHSSATLGADSPTLGPMSMILLRTESASSSQIEHLTVGARQLALAELDQSQSSNARTVLANVHAMEAALELADHLDERSILATHDVLLRGQPGWDQHAGRYRDQLVWIGTSRSSPRNAAHVGPQHELVPAAIRDLARFMAREDLPILLQAAIAHAQFELIHPFVDGNGRTGRALVHAILRGKRLLTSTTAPVSAGLLTDTRAYFDALTAYRAGDARPIVESFTFAARFAAVTGARLVDDLAGELETSRLQLRGLRKQSAGWRVLPQLVAQPVINAKYLTQHFGMNESAAQRALGQLTEAGVLQETTGFRRNRVWQHAGILRVLDGYAESLIRR
ncbi:Fic family protein [Agromyces silvae]|uniref:Fic family protein n=1 Tax=Agromyces silvae TaxID=3388266 RepID=UPI00280AF77D|nr:Fic family protein [Agromyces protaetiae]